MNGRTMTRRTLLSSASAGVALIHAGTLPCTGRTLPVRNPFDGEARLMLQTVTASTFARHIGTRFRVVCEDHSAQAMELIEVTPLGEPAETSTAAHPREPFSIVLRGPLEPVLAQRIYGFEHAKLGRFELFIVPIGPDEIGMRYEAVFN